MAIIILIFIALIAFTSKCQAQSPIMKYIIKNDDGAHFHATFWSTFLTITLMDRHYQNKPVKPRHYKRKIYLTATGVGLGLTFAKELGYDLLLKRGVPSIIDGGFSTYGTGIGLLVGFCESDFRKHRREEEFEYRKHIFEN
jgi:hypothetical protein